jgi:uncharacterized protein (DUF1684 family)
VVFSLILRLAHAPAIVQDQDNILRRQSDWGNDPHLKSECCWDKFEFRPIVMRGEIHMNTPRNPLALADWRRQVADNYASVRRSSDLNREKAWIAFHEAKDGLFKEHSESPIQPKMRRNFEGLRYYPYDPIWRVVAVVQSGPFIQSEEMDLSRDGVMNLTIVGRAQFNVGDTRGRLNIYWIEGYGGGIFVPFRDETNGNGTYNGGRYLYDTIKGVDLGAISDTILLDFNYAYNPSCAYDEDWVCPLPPRENTLPFAVEAGEKVYES